jgi:hypothetical protein
MQIGPDQIPVDNKTIVIGPPLLAPAPVPVTTSITVIGPLKYAPAVVVTKEPSAPPYAVAVSSNGVEVNSRVTNLNFVGPNVAVTSTSGTVTITVAEGSAGSIAAGTGINVVTANSVTTVTNTFTENVYQGGNATGSLTPNRNNGTIQKFTLTGNITLTPPANMSAGQSLTLILTQDSAGNRLLDANTAYLFASGFQTLSTSSGGIDMINIFNDGGTYYATLTVDYS